MEIVNLCVDLLCIQKCVLQSRESVNTTPRLDHPFRNRNYL